MTAYYNEIDPFAAEWLRRLMIDELIAWGDVDERSIEDVTPDDIRGYDQCHFFAGIGVWSYALRRAGWDDDRPIWTGSCPCQPFSAAGKGGGFADERHLWPAWLHLIEQCDPAIVVGEQVASKDGLVWLDLVRADVERTGRAFAAADLCAAGFGAPHIRQRSFWLAFSDDAERRTDCPGGNDGDGSDTGRSQGSGDVERRGATGGLADTKLARWFEPSQRHGDPEQPEQQAPRRTDTDGRSNLLRPASTVNGFWRNADWLLCRDGKWRPVEPGTFPLVNGATNRVGRLRGYGNCIAAPVAQAFIEAVMSCRP